MRILDLVTTVAVATSSSHASTLYAAVADGTVQTLALNDSGLYLSSSLKGCGASPSWLTRGRNTLYCSDEATPGSLTMFDVDHDGVLKQDAVLNTTGGDVSSVIYGEGRFIALAHYGHGSISTYTIPITDESTPLQNLTLPFPGPGPVPGRQDKGYPHEVVLDPSGRFIFSPDLGADVIRVFAFDHKSGELSQRSEISMPRGNGPRHVAFFNTSTSPEKGPTFVYVASELNNSISAFRMSANDDASMLTFTPTIIDSTTLKPGANQSASYVAEIRTYGKTLTVSNRGDQTFGKEMDSLTVWTINDDGSLSNIEHYPSGGNWPRSFNFSKDGTKVAIGDQKSKSVVVMERDVATGKIGKTLGQTTLSGEVIDVIWGPTV